jgi:2-keto-4-pentenoate hydratase/2-oxohepta-3-ene-1,7-dioic acid hydratase in catechol pathway
MKIYRFTRNAFPAPRYGILRGDLLFPAGEPPSVEEGIEDRGIPISEVKLLPPIRPTKIVAVGLNYRDHAEERNRAIPKEPLLFLMPPSAVIGPGDDIIYPGMSERVDYEGELAVVLKKRASGLDDNEDVGPYILGYTCFNDVTARDLQERDGQFTRAKSFDTFAAAGPCIATDVDPSSVRLKTFLNGKLRQSGNTVNLIFSVPVLIRFISRIMTLEPGDVITTGTPSGIGPMSPGDRVDVQIEGIGTLSNRVVKR